MIGVQDLRKGVTIELDGDLYRILDYSHNKPARGAATIRTKMNNLRTGANVERTFNSGQKVQDIRLDHAQVQYLYNDGHLYFFMNTETYVQPALSAEVLGDAINYLTENLVLKLETYEGEPISIDLPTTVDLEVIKTDPGFAGDTATGALKEALLSTGLTVKVPLFVQEGDLIRVDTRDASYVTRV
ncbi:MAG TPA: elongation factor P [Anaerolineae bacterium]|nr:elongation factor P [Anaerolineae bacterium]